MGFRFDEVMTGTWAPVDAPDDRRFFQFSAHLHAASARAHLRDPTMRLTGELRADGLATAAPIEGTLVLAPVARRRIRYAFTFAGDDGRRYRFEGEKRLRLRGLRRSLTELPGTIYDGDGARVGDVLVRFDLAADWRAFARSWRPA